VTHPGAKVKVVWTKDWLAPAKEKKAAESLHRSGGVDVLGQNVDSPATGQYAESVGIPWAGYDSDAQAFAPKSWLTAAIYHWGYYYLKRTKAAMDGTWKTGFYWGDFNDKFIDLAPYGAKVSRRRRPQSRPRGQRSRTARSTSFRARSTTRRASSVSPRARS